MGGPKLIEQRYPVLRRGGKGVGALSFQLCMKKEVTKGVLLWGKIRIRIYDPVTLSRIKVRQPGN